MHFQIYILKNIKKGTNLQPGVHCGHWFQSSSSVPPCGWQTAKHPDLLHPLCHHPAWGLLREEGVLALGVVVAAVAASWWCEHLTFCPERRRCGSSMTNTSWQLKSIADCWRQDYGCLSLVSHTGTNQGGQVGKTVHIILLFVKLTELLGASPN